MVPAASARAAVAVAVIACVYCVLILFPKRLISLLAPEVALTAMAVLRRLVMLLAYMWLDMVVPDKQAEAQAHLIQGTRLGETWVEPQIKWQWA